jgi:hypothetical protein
MPFFEFIEPPSFREPVIPKDILPRDVASMPEVQLREYFRVKGLSNKDIEVIISTRSSYRYNELSVMTNHSEIVASLSSLSPAELKSIVQAEIKLAKATGDYSGLDAQYIEVAAKMVKGEIQYSKDSIVQLECRVPPINLPKDVIEVIIKARGNSENVVAYQYDKTGRLVWLESGEMYLTSSGEKGAGFWHIENRHFEQFQSKFGKNITEAQMVEMIMEAVKNGVCEVQVDRKGRTTYIYTFQNIEVYAGDNGFIIGSHPIKNK